MRSQGGYFWPDHDKVGATAILSHAARHFPDALAKVRGRTLAVQAGGNVGVYPRNLAREFAIVVTFEPDQANFACLSRNLAGIQNVLPYKMALGAGQGRAGLRRHETNSGAHRIVDGDEVTIIAVDELDLPACDLLWLDVEGAEPEVIAGATTTIQRFHPAILFEEMGLAKGGVGATASRLASLGYEAAGRYLNDVLMLPISVEASGR